MAPSDHQCDVSPFCGPVRPRVADLGVPPGLPWRWVHIGPIGTQQLRLVEHGDRGGSVELMLPSDGPIGRFPGYSLDLLGTAAAPPGTGASYHPTAERWFVYGIAWKSVDDPWVAWTAEPDGAGRLITAYGSAGLRPDADAIAGRCKDLLTGRLLRRGRPRTDPETAWNNYELAMKAERMKADAPDLPYSAIAASLGVSERALRTYRTAAERWHWSRGIRRIS